MGSPKQRALSVKGNLGLAVNVKAREGNTKDHIMQKSSAQRYVLHPAPGTTGDQEVSPHRKGASHPPPHLRGGGEGVEPKVLETSRETLAGLMIASVWKGGLGE